MVGDRLHDVRRAAEADVLADERELRARGDEAVDEVLRERAVDVLHGRRRQQRAVGARVEHVDVEAVLVRGVAEAAVVRAERPAPRAAEVADEHRRRAGVREPVVAQHGEQVGEQAVGAPAPVGAVGAAVQDGVPRQPVRAGLGQLQAVGETAAVRRADGDRADLRHVHRRRHGRGRPR